MAQKYLNVASKDDNYISDDDDAIDLDAYNIPLQSNKIVNIDRVERVLQHILYCCDKQEGFDCYQVTKFIYSISGRIISYLFVLNFIFCKFL